MNIRETRIKFVLIRAMRANAVFHQCASVSIRGWNCFMSAAYQIIICGRTVPDPLQTQIIRKNS